MAREVVVLHPVAPFDFAASLRFLRQFPATAGEQHIDADSLDKALRAERRTIVVRLSSSGTVDDPELRCELVARETIPDSLRAAVTDRVRFWLGLDDDLADFYARADPAFAPVVEQLYGYHQVTFPSPWEHICWAILTQRTRLRVAQSVKRRLIEAFDDNRLDAEGEALWAFPDLSQLCSLSLERLEVLVSNRRKANQLERAFAALHQIDEDFLRHAPYAEVERFLLGIPGIGPWSSSFVLIRGLGRTERVPYDKEGATAASRVYGHEVDADEFHRLAAAYGPWQGYWGHYLRWAALGRENLAD